MKPHNAQWAHAARVALGATAIVGAVAVVLALAANLVIVRHLDQTIDSRLSGRLVSASRGSIDPLATVTTSPDGGDLDDAPSFVWLVHPDGTPTALVAGSPALPDRRWTTDPVQLTVDGSLFRFDATPTRDGWLVAGESVLKVSQVRDELLIAEAVLGALLLLVTFAGSFVVGLRASAPIEQVRRRQA